MNDPPKEISELLKGQLGMIALIVLLSGTVYADVYYAQFGLKLSSMGFSSTYLIYRGITAVLTSPLITFPYLFSMIWFILDATLTPSKPKWLLFRVPAAYCVIGIVLIMTYLLANHAGNQRATLDSHSETSTLPQIVSTSPAISGCDPESCRILALDSESVYVLRPTPQANLGTRSNMLILSRKDFLEIVTKVP
jgi:hypothetical protein